MNEELLKQELRDDEGEKLIAYRDSLGYWTISIGVLIDPIKGANPAPFGIDLRLGTPITREQSSQLFHQHLAGKIAEMDRRAPWWRRLSDNRQRVCLNMAYQLGVGGFLAFKKAVAAMQVGDYAKAAHEMGDSAWATIQTPNRAKRLIDRMVAG
jgi:lysozyme